MSKRKTPIDKVLPKNFANEKYRTACNNPFLWLVKAREVRRAANLVWDQFQSELVGYACGGEDSNEPFTGSVAMMLYGFTVENLLKAALVAKGVAVLPNGNFSKKSHALEDLADELSVSLDANERELLERLENFLEWGGRYPIPLYADTLYPRAMLDGSKAWMIGVSTKDRVRIESLIAKLQAILPTEGEALQSLP